MARLRATLTEIGKWLAGMAEPIYALDAQRRIVFANQACAAIVGHAETELIGQECRYHSDPSVSGIAAVAAALCPPPEVFLGQRISGEVLLDHTLARRASEDREKGGRTHLPERPAAGFAPMLRYRADFIPLTASDQPAGVLVILGARPLAEEEPGPVQDADDKLHERLLHYRARLARHYDADRLLGDSPAMRRVRNQVALAARGDASVLVIGSPGSGRGHVARTIHYLRNRQVPGPLVPLDCSVLPAELLNSTIRTLVLGGATRRTATVATLLLEEIEQLAGDTQRDLATLLSKRDLPLFVICTARAPLSEQVETGRFRSELAFALSTLTIQLPSLSQRREDLPLLTQLFVEEANSQGEKQLSGFTPESLELLLDYSWPGNITELATLVQQSHRAAEGPAIKPGDLPRHLQQAREAALYPPKRDESISLEAVLTRIETDLIQRATALAKGNKTKAARLLGMTRPKLYRRLVQLGLVDDDPVKFELDE